MIPGVYAVGLVIVYLLTWVLAVAIISNTVEISTGHISLRDLTIDPGVYYSIVNNVFTTLVGSLENKGGFYVTSADGWGGSVTIKGSSIVNAGTLAFESPSTKVSSTYTIASFGSFSNTGVIYLGVSGATLRGTPFTITSVTDWSNTGMIVLERSLGIAAPVVIQQILSLSGIPSITNHGAICLYNVDWKQTTSIEGSGCIIVASGSILHLQVAFGSLAYSVSSSQTIHLSSPKSVLSVHGLSPGLKSYPNYKVSGFGGGNEIRINLYFTRYSYSSSTGVLTLSSLLVFKIDFNIGTGYSSSLFKIFQAETGRGISYIGNGPDNAPSACSCIRSPPRITTTASTSSSSFFKPATNILHKARSRASEKTESSADRSSVTESFGSSYHTHFTSEDDTYTTQSKAVSLSTSISVVSSPSIDAKANDFTSRSELSDYKLSHAQTLSSDSSCPPFESYHLLNSSGSSDSFAAFVIPDTFWDPDSSTLVTIAENSGQPGSSRSSSEKVSGRFFNIAASGLSRSLNLSDILGKGAHFTKPRESRQSAHNTNLTRSPGSTPDTLMIPSTTVAMPTNSDSRISMNSGGFIVKPDGPSTLSTTVFELEDKQATSTFVALSVQNSAFATTEILFSNATTTLASKFHRSFWLSSSMKSSNSSKVAFSGKSSYNHLLSIGGSISTSIDSLLSFASRFSTSHASRTEHALSNSGWDGSSFTGDTPSHSEAVASGDKISIPPQKSLGIYSMKPSINDSSLISGQTSRSVTSKVLSSTSGEASSSEEGGIPGAIMSDSSNSAGKTPVNTATSALSSPLEETSKNTYVYLLRKVSRSESKLGSGGFLSERSGIITSSESGSQSIEMSGAGADSGPSGVATEISATSVKKPLVVLSNETTTNVRTRLSKETSIEITSRASKASGKGPESGSIESTNTHPEMLHTEEAKVGQRKINYSYAPLSLIPISDQSRLSSSDVSSTEMSNTDGTFWPSQSEDSSAALSEYFSIDSSCGLQNTTTSLLDTKTDGSFASVSHLFSHTFSSTGELSATSFLFPHKNLSTSEKTCTTLISMGTKDRPFDSDSAAFHANVVATDTAESFTTSIAISDMRWVYPAAFKPTKSNVSVARESEVVAVARISKIQSLETSLDSTEAVANQPSELQEVANYSGLLLTSNSSTAVSNDIDGFIKTSLSHESKFKISLPRGGMNENFESSLSHDSAIPEHKVTNSAFKSSTDSPSTEFPRSAARIKSSRLLDGNWSIASSDDLPYVSSKTANFVTQNKSRSSRNSGIIGFLISMSSSHPLETGSKKFEHMTFKKSNSRDSGTASSKGSQKGITELVITKSDAPAMTDFDVPYSPTSSAYPAYESGRPHSFSTKPSDSSNMVPGSGVNFISTPSSRESSDSSGELFESETGSRLSWSLKDMTTASRIVSDGVSQVESTVVSNPDYLLMTESCIADGCITSIDEPRVTNFFSTLKDEIWIHPSKVFRIGSNPILSLSDSVSEGSFSGSSTCESISRMSETKNGVSNKNLSTSGNTSSEPLITFWGEGLSNKWDSRSQKGRIEPIPIHPDGFHATEYSVTDLMDSTGQAYNCASTLTLCTAIQSQILATVTTFSIAPIKLGSMVDKMDYSWTITPLMTSSNVVGATSPTTNPGANSAVVNRAMDMMRSANQLQTRIPIFLSSSAHRVRSAELTETHFSGSVAKVSLSSDVKANSTDQNCKTSTSFRQGRQSQTHTTLSIGRSREYLKKPKKTYLSTYFAEQMHTLTPTHRVGNSLLRTTMPPMPHCNSSNVSQNCSKAHLSHHMEFSEQRFSFSECYSAPNSSCFGYTTYAPSSNAETALYSSDHSGCRTADLSFCGEALSEMIVSVGHFDDQAWSASPSQYFTNALATLHSDPHLSRVEVDGLRNCSRSAGPLGTCVTRAIFESSAWKCGARFEMIIIFSILVSAF
ncbi:hypothetical protein OXX59_007445 [Metschnikowia pulcherrima]